MTTVAKPNPPTYREPTMREVAALAGVGLKTVSRVVNREAGVSPALTGRVLDAVNLLGYRHNTNASALRRADQKTSTIGLLLEDVANPFSAALHRAIEDIARQRGVLVFAGSSDEDPEREQELLHALFSRRVDGLIVVPAGEGHVHPLQRRRLGRPIVIVDRITAVRDADHVTVDNRAGAVAAVRHLATHGHRRIAFLGDSRAIWTAAERHLGYVEGLAAEGLRLDPRLVRQDIKGVDAAERAASDLLASPDPPTAIFAAQNLLAMGTIRVLQRAGTQRRVALISFDDFPLADLLDPPVSVVAQDPAALGRTAAELLFARLDGEAGPARHVVVPTRLVVRGSGEIAPI